MNSEKPKEKVNQQLISDEEIDKRTSFKALDSDKDKVGRIGAIDIPAPPEQPKVISSPSEQPKDKVNIRELISKNKARITSSQPQEQLTKNKNRNRGLNK